MIFLQLFYEFFKVGLFAVGGGLATLPFLYDIADKTGWFTRADLANMIAISESTPGPIGVNMASYVGFSTTGILGCVVATLGLITPSVIVILLVAKFLQRFNENKLVKSVFYGLRPASAGLIAAAGIEVIKLALLTLDRFGVTKSLLDLFNWKGIILALLLYIAIVKFKKHPVVYIAAAAVAGAVFRFAGA